MTERGGDAGLGSFGWVASRADAQRRDELRRAERARRIAKRQDKAWSGVAGSAHVTPKAGRNLPAAIGVGLSLGALIIASLFTHREFFLVVAILGVGVATWELCEALTRTGIHVPVIPAVLGTPASILAGFFYGGHGVALAIGATIMLGIAWRAVESATGRLKDVQGIVFVACYPNLLAGFVGMLLAPPDGAARGFVFLLVTTFSDIGGYAVGVLFGKHPMAPSVSPKKSWEGFAGSVLFCVITATISIALFFHVSLLAGFLVGVLTAMGATLGDLFESLIKRDLSIKDMSAILPGHGGLMDRIDSLVITAPLVWFVLTVFVPGT